MSSSNVNPEDSKQDEVVLRDLQTLLRKSISDEVVVINFETSRLLPIGENYGSTILSVDATIKRTSSSPEEKLPLVAKMTVTSNFQKNCVNNDVTFAKEIFVFEKLVPTYRRLEQEMGLKDEELIDILPKYYGGRLTRNEETPDKVDDDVVLLMENLKARDYYMKNRMEGLDFSHAKLALTELARFHALGMAVKYKQPEFFETIKKALSGQPILMDGNELGQMWNQMFVALFADPRIAKYEDRLKALLGAGQNSDIFKQDEAIEPWVSVGHTDFWINNIMYHQVNDEVDDVKFVDFQLTSICSPLKDLPYFLCGSVSPDVIDHRFDELLDAYHERLVEVLGIVGCDTSAFTKDAFLEQLRKDAKSELMRCLLALRIFTFTMPKDIDMDDPKLLTLMSKGDSLFIERAWKIVSKFAEMEWL